MLDFLKGEKEEASLLINIGNGSITVASVLFGKNKPKFLYTSRHPFVVLEKPSALELANSVGRTLDETLSELMKKGFDHKYWDYRNKKFGRILIAFSSPWFIPKIKHVQIAKDKPFTITEDFIEDILKKEEEIFKNELNKDFEGTGFFEVIEKSIVNIKINGYVLEHNIGKVTKNFDAFLTMSVVPVDFIKKIKDMVIKHTQISAEKIVSHTFPLISFSVARDIFSNNSNFILIDVTGEVTDITLAQNDAVVGAASFPSGRNYIIRQIAKTFNTSFELAESTLRLYITKKLDDDSIKKIEQVLIGIEREWAIYFENALLELSPQMVLPYKFYITSDSDIADIYKDFMSLSKTDTTATIRKNMQITHINQDTLSNFYENDSLSQVNEFIAILAIFYDKVRKKI